MVELAIHFSGAAALAREKRFLSSHLVDDIVGPRRPLPAESLVWRSVLEKLPASMRAAPCRRLYVGSEFCPYLALDNAELGEALETAERCGFSVTHVLPVVDQSRLGGVVAGAMKLAQTLSGFEVVANEWGTLAELARSGVTAAAGRFLFKMKRLPRLGRDTVPASTVGQGAAEARNSLLASQMKELSRFAPDEQWFASLLERLGVERVETEMVPQGVVSSSASPGPRTSLQLPWTYVTGGGECPVARFAARDGQTVCARRCRSTFIVPSYPKATWRLLQLGHTVFFPAHPLLDHYLKTDRYDRYVLEPGPAM